MLGKRRMRFEIHSFGERALHARALHALLSSAHEGKKPGR